MRKLSIDKMSKGIDVQKADAVIGSSFERSKNSENMIDRSETIIANSYNFRWTLVICF